MGYTGELDAMWLSVFGDTVLAAIALVAVLLILCYQRGLEPHQSFIVMLPTIVALTAYNDQLPPVVRNGFVIVAGAIIGLGIIRFFKV